MFKLVVLCAAVAAAAAEPGVVAPYVAPLTYSTAVLPSPAVISPASGVVHASPYFYSYGSPYLTHYIKKRSAPLFTTPYLAPTFPGLPLPHSFSYSYASPLLHTTYSAPALHYAHLIKKRSAPLLAAAAYVAPASYSHQSRVDVHHSSPIITSYSTPLAYASPYTYTHLY